MKKSKSLRAETSRLEIDELVGSVEDVTVYRIQCCVCGESCEEEDPPGEMQGFAEDLYQNGWRNRTSDKFAVEGAMCPNCVAQPDNLRGE